MKAYIDLRRRSGDPDHSLFVDLDNAQAIDAAGLFTGKRAYWCGSRVRRLDQALVARGRLIGRMRPVALLQVADCVLSYVRDHPEELARNARRNLQWAVYDLRASLAESGK